MPVPPTTTSTSSPPPARSPSSTATPDRGSISEKCTVRAKGGWLTATRVSHPGQLVRVASQRLIQTRPGDWLVEDAGTLLDVCTDQDLRKKYDLQESGQLILSPTIRRQFEDLLGIGSTESGDRVLALVARLAQLQLGTLTISLTPAQAEEIARRAARNNLTPQQGVQRVLDRLQEELFPRTSGVTGNGSGQ